MLEEDRQSFEINNNVDEGDTAIKLKTSSFAWELSEVKNSETQDLKMTPQIVLKSISLEIKKGELVFIIGDVGCGKSSLLRCLLNDMYLCDNQEIKKVLTINGTISYVSQTPWIQNATLMDNIILFKPMKPELYSKVLNVCELETDMKILDGGDLTEVGEQGINLSGGQKMRISIARGVYSQSDIYLFDDPLSALDGNVSQSIYSKLITKYLKDKTRILVTNDHSNLQEADRIILMKQGEIIFNGTYQSLVDQGLIEILPQRVKEERKNRKMKYYSQFLFFSTGATNKFETKIMTEETREVGKVSFDVYLKFFKYSGGKCTYIVIILSTFLGEIVRRGGDYWMKIWMSDPVFPHSYNNYLVYASICIFIIVFIYLRIKFLVLGNLKLCNKLHSEMIENLINAPINLYHDSEPRGRIFNRLSVDLENLNSTINFMGCIFVTFFSFIGMIFIISFYNPWILIWIPFTVFFSFKCMNLYTPPSRELKRLEGHIRSKVLNVITEITPGITIVISDNQIGSYRNKIEKLLTELTKLRIFIGGLDNWNGFISDLIGYSLVVVVIIFIAVLPELFTQVTAGQSLMFTSMLKDKMLWFVYSLCNFEKIMVSMERCLEYTKLPAESETHELQVSNENNSIANSQAELKNSFISSKDSGYPEENELNNHQLKKQKVLTDDWPESGKVEFINYSTAYRPGTQLVIKNANISINAGEKIGVVGRTGSGKSTLSLCIFRLLEASNGCIEIDGIDISKVPLKRLRESLTIIPQDSAILEGSLRFNIDPLLKYKDEEIMSVLEAIGLWDILKVHDINVEISEESLSAGERQLVCIARAILRKSKIIIIDEATASIDYITEEKIQNAFKTFLAGSTVIAIAHRINTVSSYDRILVLDNGKVKEFGSHSDLVQNHRGIYYGLQKCHTLKDQ